MASVRFSFLVLILGLFVGSAYAQPVWQTGATAVGTAASATVGKPSGTVSGDLLIVGIMFEKGTDVAITATGWTLIRRTNNGTDVGMATYWKWAGGAEPASYSFPLSNGPKWAIGMSRITGADASTPIDISGQQTGDPGNVTAPSVNTTVANTLVLAFYTNKKHRTYTPDATTAERYDDPNAAAGLPSNMLATFVRAATGASGDKTATPVETEKWAGQQVAVRPAVSTTPGSFNAFETSTAAGSITGVIRTRVVGTAFSLDVVAIASGAQLSSFTNTVTVELLGNNTLGVALDANNCPVSFTTVQTVSPDPTITSGRSTVSFAAVANSWRDVRVRVRYPTSSPTVTSCSTDNFAIRPASFAAAVTDNDWQSAGTGRALTNTGATGGNVHKAGRNFTITVTPAPAGATNYNGDPTVSTLACTLPTPCASGTLAVGTFSGSGTRTSNTATYSEAGAFNLTLVDQDFASVDSTDGTPADCTAAGRYVCQSPAPLAVGRFVPDRFALTAVTPPVLRTFCTFTYIGQPFGYQTLPVATISAQNASGGTTTNYRGALWKLASASASQSLANSPVETLDVTQILAPTVTETPDTGTGTFTANVNDQLAFVRNNAAPRAPFNANLSLTWSVSDAAEAGANQGTITTATALVFNGGGSGIAFDSGNALRYGRLRLGNANGSQLVPLPVQLEAQYWGYTNPPTNTVLGFITNGADNCTTIANDNLAMSAFGGNLVACETAVSGGGAFSAGRRMLLLAAPGNTNDGSVILTVNLGAAASGTTCTTVGGATVPAAGANRAYLQGNWSGANYDQNPAARATFGVFKGADEVIFIRENF